jgi:hypothetical protein
MILSNILTAVYFALVCLDCPTARRGLFPSDNAVQQKRKADRSVDILSLDVTILGLNIGFCDES